MIPFLGDISDTRRRVKLPKEDTETAEAGRRDREARSIAIEKVCLDD